MGKRQLGKPPAVRPQVQEHVVTQVREYSLITPLVGGGAVTGEQDAVTAVRGTEIRGQLRFWWRACYGGRYSEIEDMKEAEGRIWGKANEKEDTAPKFEETIQIVVEPIQKGERVLAFLGKPPRCDKDIPAYAAFALQPTDTEPAKPIYKKVRFRLTISFPVQLQRDIMGTLWAWETFGGVGARTRRGFGALKLDKVVLIERIGDSTEKRETIIDAPPVHSDVKRWITAKFAEFGIDQKAPKGVPSLSQNMLAERIYVLDNGSGVNGVWKSLIDELRKFRQDKQWPDREAIKKLRNEASPSHEKRYRLPKAALGLPIVYHFPKLGKQADLTLQGAEKGYDRLASSLILRPLFCQHGKAVGLVILLENDPYPIHSKDLQVMEKGQLLRPATIETDRAANSVQMLDGENNVLKAFMNYLASGKKGHKVSRENAQDNDKRNNKRWNNKRGNKR